MIFLIDNIKDKIAEKLAIICPETPIYKNNQKMGFKEPSFFIVKIGTEVKPEWMNYQFRKYSYQLIYFPDPEDINSDIEAKESILLDTFTELNEFAKIRNREFKVSDDTLQVIFEIWLRAKPVDHTPKQAHMKFKGGITDGR